MKLFRNYNPDDFDYSEEDQERPCRFAFPIKVEGGYEISHLPVLCRDFLNDTLVWKAKETPGGTIYGYKYRGKITKSKTRLMIEDHGNLVENIVFLNKIEKENDIPLTKIIPLETGEVIVEGDKWWMSTTVHFSWLTSLLRWLTHDNKVKSWDDVNYDSFANKYMNDFKKLPAALKRLKVTKVAGASDTALSAMHKYNGWFANVNKCMYTAQYARYNAELREILDALPTP